MMKSLLDQKTKNRKGRHPECLGYEIWTDLGREYSCEYEHAPLCEECIYGGCGGWIDPETGKRKKKKK